MSNHTASRGFRSDPGGKRAVTYGHVDTTEFDSLSTIADQCGPVIYAVLLDDGNIKIGYTANLDHRLGNLGCGLRGLLALMPGTLAQEQFIHSKMVGHRAHGHEYYKPTASVISVVNQMRAKMGLTPLAIT